MFECIKVAWHQAHEAFAGEGLRGIIRPRFFWKRKATPVEMELATISPASTDVFREAGCCFDEIRMEDLRVGKWSFLTPSRSFKVLCNLKKGWRDFVLHQDGRVIGDVWCVTPRGDGSPVSHPDLRMLGIVCGYREAYAFDMQIAHSFRGKNLAAPLQRSLQSILKTEGLHKVYGYYWDDNLPALWMHRTLKFKELPKRQISRFLWFTKTKIIRNSTPRS